MDFHNKKKKKKRLGVPLCYSAIMPRIELDVFISI